jgi:Domain of unknown function (DUF5658)
MSDSLTLTRESPRLAASRLPSILCSFRAFATPILACFVLALSTFDGLATLCLITDGSDEANPVMRTLLAWGPGPFLVGKLALTTAGVWGIVAVRGRRLFGTRLRAGHVLLGLAGVYGLVAVYELVLLILLTA